MSLLIRRDRQSRAQLLFVNNILKKKEIELLNYVMLCLLITFILASLILVVSSIVNQTSHPHSFKNHVQTSKR